MAEGARLESAYTPKGYRGFESRFLRKNFLKKIEKQQTLKKHISLINLKFKFKSNNVSSKESSCIYEISLYKNKDFLNEIVGIKGISEVNLLNQDGESQY